MSRNMLFVINPHAGKSEIRQKLLEIIELFVRHDYEVTVYTTRRGQELPAYIAAHASRYDRIVCSGGDGTFNETVSGLMECGSRPELGYIPAGTVNDFASSLGISKNLVQAAGAAVHGVPCVCDIGAFNDRYFTYIAAFGAFTEVSYQTPQQFKNVLGRAAYLLEGLIRIPGIKPYHVVAEYESGRVEGDFIFGMVSNSTSVGGFKLGESHYISMSDGLMEVLLIRNPKSMLEMHNIMNALLMQNPDPDCIVVFKTAAVTFRSEQPLHWTLDGEYGGTVRQAVIENKKHALCVLVEPQEAVSAQGPEPLAQ